MKKLNINKRNAQDLQKLATLKCKIDGKIIRFETADKEELGNLLKV